MLDLKKKRLKILDEGEIMAFYGLPQFTPKERAEYFSLSLSEKSVLDELHSIKSKIFFLLQLGYFKVRQMFFIFDFSEVEGDIKYIQKQYFPDFQPTELKISKRTRLKQQRLILKLCSHQTCNAANRLKIEAKARQAAVVCSKPISGNRTKRKKVYDF